MFISLFRVSRLRKGALRGTFKTVNNSSLFSIGEPSGRRHATHYQDSKKESEEEEGARGVYDRFKEKRARNHVVGTHHCA